MSSLFEDILEGRRLSVEEGRTLMENMLHDQFPITRVVALVTCLRVRGVTVDLLDGFSQALLEAATSVDLGCADLVDVCGTGGDGKDSFNISTTVAFILAGAGYRVAKHGNVAVSSSCGSSDVLEALGVPLTADPSRLRRSLERSGVCFLHAPLFHPAMRRFGAMRKELGFKTVFNALGPLVNPARPSSQFVGVYSLELQRLYSTLLRRRPGRFAVVHSLDGYDEVSLTGVARVTTRQGAFEVHPQTCGVSTLSSASIRGPANAAEGAALITAILQGQCSPEHEAVTCANAAVAMHSFEGHEDISHCMEKARESLRSGRALQALQRSKEV
jgi:anthranilate phosphoribosyltransferase